MKRVLAALFLFVGTVFAAAYAPAQSLSEQIVGVWLVTSVVTDDAGQTVDLFSSPNPTEEFTFTRDGRFSLRVLSRGHSKLVSKRMAASHSTTKNKAGYIAESGTFTIETIDGSPMVRLVGSQGSQALGLAQITADKMTWKDSTSSPEAIVIVLRRSH